MPDPTQAVVVAGEVTTVIVIDSATAAAWTADGTVEALWPGATLVDVTGLDPAPGVGWAYDGATFTPPAPPAADPPATEPAPAEPAPAPVDPAPATDAVPLPVDSLPPVPPAA